MIDEILDTGAAPNSFNLGLTPLHPPYKQVIRVHTAILMAILAIAAIIADLVLASAGDVTVPGMIMVPVLVVAVYAIIALPERKYRRWGYDAGDEHLRIVRGFVFRTDTIVPFNRIQHIDVGQGPIERIFGISTLTVHTAGTHNSIVTLPGLASDDAMAMREAIRAHIRPETA